MRLIVSSRRYFPPIKSIFFLLVFSIFFFFILLSVNSLLIIKKIIIEGVDKKTVIRGLNAYYNKNLFFLSSENLKKNLLDENPQFRLIDVIKIYPNTLKINVALQSAIAVLEMNAGYAYLSDNGKIVKKERKKNSLLPLIHYYQKPNYITYGAGEEITYFDILTTLYFIDGLTKMGLKIDTVDINGQDMLLFNLGSRKIIFTTEKNKEIQNYELEQIIKQFKIEGRDFKSLDLRFEKPVIIF